MSTGILVDISRSPEPDEQEWDEKYWIVPSSPRIYPKSDAPPVVLRRREQILKLPDSIIALFPLPAISVHQILETPSFVLRQNLVISPIEFSLRPPDTNPHAIAKVLRIRSIPPLSAALEAYMNFGQAWFNGSLAIVDTLYVDTIGLPLYVLTFWREAHHVEKSRTMWKNAQLWLDGILEQCNHANTSKMKRLQVEAEKSLKLFQEIPWNMPILGFPSTGWRPKDHKLTSCELDASTYLDSGSSAFKVLTTSFAQFFEHDYLDDEVVNMMLHYVRLRDEQVNGASTKTIIGDTSLTVALMRFKLLSGSAKGEPVRIPAELRQVEHLVKDSRRSTLYYPVNPGKNHWAIIKVSFGARTYAYGDSLAGSYSEDASALEDLVYWLQQRFENGSKQTFQRNLVNIPTDRQRDGWSCGITSCQMISVALGFDEPWEAISADYFRVLWANRLMEHHLHHTETSKSEKSVPNIGRNAMKISNLLGTDHASGAVGLKGIEMSTRSPRSHLGSSSPAGTNIPSPSTSVIDIESGPSSPIERNSNASYSQLVSDTHDLEVATLDQSDQKANNTRGDVNLIPNEGHVHNTHTSPACASAPRLEKRTHSQNSVVLPRQRQKLDTASQVGNRPIVQRKEVEKSTLYGPIGISASAQESQRIKASIHSGDFDLNPFKQARFLRKVQETLDKGAKEDPSDTSGRRLIHSLCGSSILLDLPYHIEKFRRHVIHCKKNGGMRKNAKGKKNITATANTPKLDILFQKMRTKPSKEPQNTTPSLTVPNSGRCLGLRIAHDSRLSVVFAKGVISGGGTSIQDIARGLYTTPFSDLTQDQKDSVYSIQASTHIWNVNYRPHQHVRYIGCTGEIKVPGHVEVGTPVDICSDCIGLLDNPKFQTLLNRKMPMPENQIFVPKIYRNDQLGRIYAQHKGITEILDVQDPKHTPCIQLAIKTLQGRFKTATMFTGLMEVMVLKDDRVLHHKGMRGIKYPPGYLNLMHRVQISSPQVYRILKKEIPAPDERYLRLIRSQNSRFQLTLGPEVIARAKEYIEKTSYTGPLALSCDETKLIPSLSTYHDASCNQWFLIGGPGDPIAISGDVEELSQLLKDPETKKATLLRLWCLQNPMPGVPTLLLAAIPVSSSSNSEELMAYHNIIVNGLLAEGIRLSSYSCDGSAKERRLTRNFVAQSSHRHNVQIPHPIPSEPPLEISISFFGEKAVPIAILQDSKHLLKTLRNNLFSGSRLLVIGNSTLHYAQVYRLAHMSSSPLFLRDVCNLDRQDDAAATRLFSPGFLSQILDTQKEVADNKVVQLKLKAGELNGLAVYVFVFGELIDAFQNRSISHLERSGMVLRAYYFLTLWKRSLVLLGYPLAKHYISREAEDICNWLITGYFSLLVIHRDHFDEHYPFLPWHHSTEAVEHTFAECRKHITDFTLGEFKDLVPKLTVILDSAMQVGNRQENHMIAMAGWQWLVARGWLAVSWGRPQPKYWTDTAYL